MAWVVTVGEHRAEVAPALVTVPARAEAQVADVEAMEAGAEVPRTSALVREWSLVGPKATVAVVLPARTRVARLKGPSSLMLYAPAPPQAWRLLPTMCSCHLASYGHCPQATIPPTERTAPKGTPWPAPF